MRKISGRFGAVAGITAFMGMMLAAAIAAPAQTFTRMASFNGANGSNPDASLTQGTDGNLYGTTSHGGTYGAGTVYKITLAGALTTLYDFSKGDGAVPVDAPALGVDGNFYGTTFDGGTGKFCRFGCGTLFKISAGGGLTTLHGFGLTDGSNPAAGLVLGVDGSFYGTTVFGGAYDAGTVFKMTSSGVLTTLYVFNGIDGNQPYAELVQGTDGSLYGTTYQGGASGYGTVFRVSPAGAMTVLHSFNGADGANPFAGLIQGVDGGFYGTTNYGGANGSCSAGGSVGCGTIYKITPDGTLTTLHSFDSTDGAVPGTLVQATDGNLYGTTVEGTPNSFCPLGCGTIFKISSDGLLTTLHAFDGMDGSGPQGSLVQDTNGNLYGTTFNGGASGACLSGCGTVFRLSLGLVPFLRTLPATGKAGRFVIILGTNLTGATSVTFNGTPATFTVESATALKATVPAGATTGPVEVTWQNGTLTSNVNFQVLP
jgi:uncharacterized repeat protein (TIGR03803 family)